MFTENSGLAFVVPLDYAIKLAKQLILVTNAINKSDLETNKNDNIIS